jgi:hypothetical protein
LDGDELRADFLVLVRLNLCRDRGWRPLRPGDPTEPIAWVLPLRVAQGVWEQGAYRHSTRPALQIRPVRDVLDKYEESWHLVARKLGV